MAEYTLLLGADRGDPAATFEQAFAAIRERIGPIGAFSREHWTTPWGFQGDRLFLNRAVLVDSGLEPGKLMDELLAIEAALGRKRSAGEGYAPRVIDIDVLFAGQRVINRPNLVVPHPKVQFRHFALAPAADIVPALIHPLLGESVWDLLNQLEGMQ